MEVLETSEDPGNGFPLNARDPRTSDCLGLTGRLSLCKFL